MMLWSDWKYLGVIIIGVFLLLNMGRKGHTNFRAILIFLIMAFSYRWREMSMSLYESAYKRIVFEKLLYMNIDDEEQKNN